MSVEQGETSAIRVLLQERLAAVLRSPWGGLVVAAVLFGLVHAPGFYLRPAATQEALGSHPSLFVAVGYSIVLTSLVASGILGAVAFRRGWVSGAFGLVLHSMISFAAAAVFVVASHHLPVVMRAHLGFWSGLRSHRFRGQKGNFGLDGEMAGLNDRSNMARCSSGFERQ